MGEIKWDRERKNNDMYSESGSGKRDESFCGLRKVLIESDNRKCKT